MSDDDAVVWRVGDRVQIAGQGPVLVVNDVYGSWPALVLAVEGRDESAEGGDIDARADLLPLVRVPDPPKVGDEIDMPEQYAALPDNSLAVEDGSFAVIVKSVGLWVYVTNGRADLTIRRRVLRVGGGS